MSGRSRTVLIVLALAVAVGAATLAYATLLEDQPSSSDNTIAACPLEPESAEGASPTPAKYTFDELQALQDTLFHEVERLRSEGVMVEAFGVDETHNRLLIELSNPGEYQRMVIAGLLGCDRVLIKKGGPNHYE